MTTNREAFEMWSKFSDAQDNKQNENSFKVQVIDTPIPVSGPATTTDDPETLNKAGIDSKWQFMGRLIDKNMPHEKFLENVCDSSVSDKTNGLSCLHSIVTVSKAGAMPAFGPGDIVEISCDAAAGDIAQYDLQGVDFERVIEVFREPSKTGKDVTCAGLPAVTNGKIAANFGAIGTGGIATVGTVGGAGPMLTTAKDYTGVKNIIIDWYTAINAHASFNNTTLITGPESPNVRAIAEAELNKWQFGSLKENKPEAAPYLRAYEQNQGLSTNYFPGKPWSAGYIVYIMKQAGTSFKSGASHYKYSRDLYKARMAGATSGWSMFSVLERVKIGVGDVFVKPRGPKHYYSHGDVVYKIEDNVAYLTGGNVGNTAKIAAKIQLKEDGTIVSPGPYLVIDKFLG